jgi:hypothetical protein
MTAGGVEISNTSRRKGRQGSSIGKTVSVHTVYLPVYSHIYFGDGKPYLLTTTLAIRNADLARSIIIKSVKYYDTNGKLVRSYLADPLELDALVSREILVEEHDTAGDQGRNSSPNGGLKKALSLRSLKRS